MQIGWIGSYREVNLRGHFRLQLGCNASGYPSLLVTGSTKLHRRGVADLSKPAHGSVTTVGTFTRAPPLYFPDHWRGISMPSLFINFSKVSNFAQRRDEKRFHAGPYHRPPRYLPVTESSVTLPPELEAIASCPSGDQSAPRAKQELCWRGLHRAPSALTSGRSSALRAIMSIRLWSNY
jgi:hypothetical protein